MERKQIENIKRLMLPSKVFVTWKDFDIMITYLTARIKESGRKYNRIMTFKRGGLIPAVCFAHRLGITDIRIEKQRAFILTSRETLVVDDIADTGETLEPYWRQMDTCTLYTKTCSRVVPKYTAKYVTPQIWVVFPWELKNEKEMRDRDKMP